MIVITPGYIESVFEPAYAGVISFHKFSNFRFITDKTNGLFVDFECKAVFAFAGVQPHSSGGVIDSKDSCKFVLAGDNRAVKYAVCARDKVTRNYRIVIISPDDGRAAFWAVLPGDVRQRFCDDGLL